MRMSVRIQQLFLLDVKPVLKLILILIRVYFSHLDLQMEIAHAFRVCPTNPKNNKGL